MERRNYRQQFSLSISTKGIEKIYAFGFCLLILALFFYQIINGSYYRQRAQNNYVRLIPLSAIRGSIFDRNGIILAYDRAVFNISVIPHQIRGKKDSLFKDLTNFLNYDPGTIQKNYRKNLRSFFSPVNIILDIHKDIALKLKEEFQDAILINPQPQRYYPYPYSFAHLLGYVKPAVSHYEKLKKYGYKPLERIGLSGIEQYYNTYLRGEDGGDLVEVNSQGRVVGFLGKRHPKKGENIYLTIDKRIQIQGFEALGGKKGVIILMKSVSGEIIALCSSPSFDPNNFIKGKNIAKFLTDKSFPLLNRAIQASYPIGSTFKPIIALAALDDGKIKSTETFLCKGKIQMGLATFRCWDTHGIQDLYQAIVHSCNSYFYSLGLNLGPNALSRWAKKFGLDSLTGIDLPYEKKGFVPSPQWKKRTLKQNWFAGDTLNFSIGQGFMEVTPLENTIAINVFANNGYLVKPQILKKVRNIPSGLPSRTYLKHKKENLKKIKQGLRGAVNDKTGTATLLKRLGFQLSGKTGTAQTNGQPHGWFMGYFTHKKTTYTICVFLENGKSSYEALRVVNKFLKNVEKEDLL